MTCENIAGLVPCSREATVRRVWQAYHPSRWEGADLCEVHSSWHTRVDFIEAIGDPNGVWLAGAGGTEEPFTARDGRRLQRVWQPSTGQHGYLDLSTDIVTSDKEASQ